MRWITAMHCADEQNLLFAFSPDQVDQVDQVDQADQVNELGIKTGEATGVRGVSGSFMGRVCRRWRVSTGDPFILPANYLNPIHPTSKFF